MAGSPLIFDIRHFALDDGPGIRTTVFLKGCPLSCEWCHNPESKSINPEIAFYPQLCIGCGHCTNVCPENAVSLDNPNRIKRATCTVCGACTKECPAEALKTIGRYYSPGELVDILLRDRIFYDTSDGGVTFSGGEPTADMNYVREVMRKLKNNKVHIAIQTSGMFDLSEFRMKILPHIDLILFDIKIIDQNKHEYYTGRSNEQILSNFTELCKESSVSVVPTVPVVPGITATVDNLISIANLLRSTGCSTYELKPYNPGGISKRIMTGKSVPQNISDTPMRMEELKRLRQIFRSALSI